LAAQPPHVVPVKPALQAQLQDAGAPLTDVAWPLQRAAVLHTAHEG
jgi:hypothetical protein